MAHAPAASTLGCMVFLRVLGVGVLALVLLTSGAYVVRGPTGTVEVSRTKERVLQHLDEQLPTATRESGRGLAALRAQLRASGAVEGIGSAPAYSWRELECGFSSRDAGWIVQSYGQDCQVRSVELYAGSSPVESSACERVVPPGTGAGRGSVVRAATTALAAEDRDWSCPRVLTAPGAPVGSERRRLLEGSRPEDLDSGPSWVVVEAHSEPIVTDIGCSPWGVFFCSQPYDVPLMGS